MSTIHRLCRNVIYPYILIYFMKLLVDNLLIIKVFSYISNFLFKKNIIFIGIKIRK